VSAEHCIAVSGKSAEFRIIYVVSSDVDCFIDNNERMFVRRRPLGDLARCSTQFFFGCFDFREELPISLHRRLLRWGFCFGGCSLWKWPHLGARMLKKSTRVNFFFEAVVYALLMLYDKLDAKFTKEGAQVAVDPERLFKTAEVFRASSLILGNLMNQGMPQYMFPMVMCSAFSLELHLKCLILIERSASARGHDLEQLFSKITMASQTMIRRCYEKQRAKAAARFAAVKGVPQPKTDFDFVLHVSAKAFEKFRYAYEGIAESPVGWMAAPICDCVRERILELQPDWENLKYGLNGPLMPPGM
jgi:hypothetical protein